MELSACGVMGEVAVAFGDRADGEGRVDSGVGCVELALRWDAIGDFQLSPEGVGAYLNGHRYGTA